MCVYIHIYIYIYIFACLSELDVCYLQNPTNSTLKVEFARKVLYCILWYKFCKDKDANIVCA